MELWTNHNYPTVPLSLSCLQLYVGLSCMNILNATVVLCVLIKGAKHQNDIRKSLQRTK